jgi:hypothetical protein
VITGIAAAGVLGALGQPAAAFAEASGVDPNTRVRWDIISINFAASATSAGGHASAMSVDGSMITMTGSGIFIPSQPKGVTGGGAWTLLAKDGSVSGSGTYDVTGFVRYDWAPGGPNASLTDLIGSSKNFAGGLAVLTIDYSDGDAGILIVSCHPPTGGPATTFEGIRASKGYVMYWDGTQPVNGVDANRTAFHLGPASPYMGPGSWFNGF